jgi:isochorismate synthase
MSVSLASPVVATATQALIDRSIAHARELNGPAYLSIVDPLPWTPVPLAFLRASAAALATGVLWSQPRAGATFAGAGSAFTLRASGPGRFGLAASASRDLKRRLIRDDEAAFPALGGFAFAEAPDEPVLWHAFPDAILTVPRVVLQVHDAHALVRVTLKVDPTSSPEALASELGSQQRQAREWCRATSVPTASGAPFITESIPSRAAWESSVATAVALIDQGMLAKVVLAREERLRAATPFSPIAALQRLRAADADATLYALQSGSDWFIGATPERLVRLDAGRVDVTCLAGSIDVGKTPEERRALAAQLLASEKDREEHEIVVRSTMSALADTCDDVERLAGTPRIVVARSVQHLETPISGRLAAAGHVLDLVERLHPTPAVGGFPRERALAMIRELERIERGWYAGPFGWVDSDGSGEFAVAIRSALLSGCTASVFAGCGIVAGSVPAEEYAESRLKMRPMLAALGAA